MVAESRSGTWSPERRRHARVTFTPLLRPHLTLPLGRHDVLDASLGGLRVHDPSPVAQRTGTRIDAMLEWIHGEPPIRFVGTIAWSTRSEFGVAGEPNAIPLGYLPWAAPGKG